MVQGRIEFVPEAGRFDRADVHVYVEDTTYADDNAVELFHMRLPGVSYGGDEGIAFTLDYNPPQSAGRARTLRVLVDMDRDGRPGRGDYVSYQAVTLPEEGVIARVRVRRIE
jgi:hypothetical protein